MTIKPFTVRFFVGNVGPKGSASTVSEALAQLLKATTPHTVEGSEYAYIVRSLEELPYGFRGVICKLRLSDIPHKGSLSGTEEELALASNEGLIEKNYFIFYSDHQLLVFQDNFHGTSMAMFSHFLTTFVKAATTFNPVIRAETLSRLMAGDTEVRKIDLSIARPTNPDLFPKDDFSVELLRLLQSSDAARISVKLTANGPGMRGNTLYNNVKNSLRSLVESNSVKKAQVEVESDGRIMPIDLVADRLYSRQIVEMKGRYPYPPLMFQALETARSEMSDELAQYFGENQNPIS